MKWPFLKRADATAPADDALATVLTHWLRLKGLPVPIEFARQQLATTSVSADLAGATRLAQSLDERTCFIRLDGPQLAALPLLCHHPEHGWQVVTARDAQGLWSCVGADRARRELVLDGVPCLHAVADGSLDAASSRSALSMMLGRLSRQWPIFMEAAGLSLVLALVGIAISFYTMQVYDRVIPNQGYQTLWVLTLGVGLAVLIEFLLKMARASLLEPRLKRLDIDISKALMARLNAVRLDQRPGSVGTLASQVQSFESIRGILSASTLFLLFDMPMALLFALVIGAVGGPWMALPAIALFGVTLSVGLLRARRIARLTASNLAGANAKTGLLVETIEGTEAIKGLGAGWRFETRWAALSETNATQSLALKHETDATGYIAAALQQVSYVALICIGAALAIDGHLTQGAIVACSILSGRVLSPLASIPSLMVQIGSARASMTALDAIFKLETDNEAVTRPVVPEALHGDIRFEDVEFRYPGQRDPLRIGHLHLRPGEKVAILGTIGAGKTTLLSLACGLAKPSAGTVFLDGVDQQQIHAGWRSSKMAYCPQHPWLFSGTLRENLLFGLPELSDEQLLAACRQTGLWQLIGQHPLGLDRKLSEGGRGLSGGQRQLVALTRLLLADRGVWLLDEPTSGMDDGLEQASVRLMKQALRPETSLLLVTHRLSLLALVDRVIVLSPQGVLADGPRDTVLARLQQRPVPAAAAPQGQLSASPASGQDRPAPVAAT
ncbi:MAG: ATP-binding cassette domain-containing protein [Mitsuaria chitosanitabida]|uniref:ATP-binding cassette domain-containing protein n=1 Tax=Roseateles chitosanitabidus TaxID=65048 RepID=UPI001B13F9D5|nr:ATP-binding cassette domain-containing protein [Roseateles chitosanitabidus]MBO9687865.1 ATP-binding cassette domain-containing protein [Roseateles chitosanitabidus]